jgi:hypothetical protein
MSMLITIINRDGAKCQQLLLAKHELDGVE